jgi:hypothetical protein
VCQQQKNVLSCEDVLKPLAEHDSCVSGNGFTYIMWLFKFYPHLANENLVPLQNLNSSLLFVQFIVCSRLPSEHELVFFLHPSHLHEKASAYYTSARTMSQQPAATHSICSSRWYCALVLCWMYCHIYSQSLLLIAFLYEITFVSLWLFIYIWLFIHVLFVIELHNFRHGHQMKDHFEWKMKSDTWH